MNVAKDISMKSGVSITTCFSIAFVLMLFANPFSYAQTDTSAEDIEVVDVIGQRPLSYYRKQLVQTEMAFYDMYNALADVKEFKIRCRTEKPSGSHIARKVCYPQYELNAIAFETQIAMIPKAQDTRGIIEPLPTSTGIRELVSDKKADATEYLLKLLKDNPELLAQFNKLTESMVEYQQAKTLAQKGR